MLKCFLTVWFQSMPCLALFSRIVLAIDKAKISYLKIFYPSVYNIVVILSLLW